MAVDVTSSILINRPRTEVAAYAMDLDKSPLWYANIKSVEWKTQPPLTLGSQVAFVAHFLGRRLAYTYEVTTLVMGERLVMRTSEGPVPMETSYQFESVNGATRMTLRNRGMPTGFAAVVAPFMAMGVRHANRKDLLRLKRVLESSS
jgi:uncharacterized membrane protein